MAGGGNLVTRCQEARIFQSLREGVRFESSGFWQRFVGAKLREMPNSSSRERHPTVLIVSFAFILTAFASREQEAPGARRSWCDFGAIQETSMRTVRGNPGP